MATSVLDTIQHIAPIWSAGFVGSIGLEMVAIMGCYQTLNYNQLQKYRMPGYIFTRIFFAIFIAGTIPVIVNETDPWKALGIGVATPIVLYGAGRLASRLGELISGQGPDDKAP